MINQSIFAISSFNARPDAWKIKEAQLTEKFDKQYGALYELYGVSGKEYVLYYAEKRNDVESYLDARPEDRTRIEELGEQVSTLLEQYEQLKIDLLQIDSGKSQDRLWTSTKP